MTCAQQLNHFHRVALKLLADATDFEKRPSELTIGICHDVFRVKQLYPGIIDQHPTNTIMKIYCRV